MERVEAMVSGKVQVVMYRDFARQSARALSITGEVKNLADGRVQVIAEGERANLEALIKKLKEGPVLARVDGIDVTWHVATGAYADFSIV